MENYWANIARQKQKSRRNSVTDIRDKYIRLIENGTFPDHFVKFLKKSKNEKGEKIIVDPWAEDYARLISDFRFPEVNTTGIAQYSKSLFHFILQSYLVQVCGLNTLFSFTTSNVRDKIVPLQIKPIIEAVKESNGINYRPLTDNNKMHKTPLGTALFTFVNDPRGQGNGSGVAASKELVSVSVDLVLSDEYSQYDLGAAEPLARRMDNGRIFSKPRRNLGTPGSGNGIEALVNRSDYIFYPHVTCRNCRQLIALDPYGCLFQRSRVRLPNGSEVDSYLDITGKPKKWLHNDESDPVKTAYFGCPHCQHEILDEDRLTARLLDIKTKISVKELQDQIEDEGILYGSVGIIISPLVRRSKTNLAFALVNDGLLSTRPSDYLQQRLGKPSDQNITGINDQAIFDSIGLPEPNLEGYSKTRVLGIDQGASQHYAIVVDYYYPKEVADPLEQYAKVIRVVKAATPITSVELGDFYVHWGIEVGGVDNEPYREFAHELVSSLNFLAIDQKGKQKDAYKATEFKYGGLSLEGFDIRPGYFFDQIVNSFYSQAEDGKLATRLPANWDKFLVDQGELSPIRHFKAIAFDYEVGLWKRPSDKVDHFMFAFLFAESSFFIWLNEKNYKVEHYLSLFR